MAFKLTPSFQRNAAPLQSYVKKAGAGVTPNAQLSAMNANVPRANLANQDVAPKMAGVGAPRVGGPMGGASGMIGGGSPIVGYAFDPLFLSLMDRTIKGRK